MSISLAGEHAELQGVAREFLAARKALAAARDTLDPEASTVPGFWAELAGLGWTGLHIPEQLGGAGASYRELAVVLEEAGRVLVPGPLLASTIVSGTVAALAATPASASAWLTGLADGSLRAGIGLGGRLRWSGDVLDGDAGVVLSAASADVLLLVVDGADVVLVEPNAAGVSLHRPANLDPTQPAARVSLAQVRPAGAMVFTGGRPTAVAIARTLAAAQAAGIASATVELAVAYAGLRAQFGRTIGSFQAVKHLCAEMLVSAELAAAVAWDAAAALSVASGPETELAAAVAATVGLSAAQDNAERCIQIHGAIGFTWEHDAHLYLRRAAALNALFGRGAPAEVAVLSAAGVRRRHQVALPDSVGPARAEAQEFARSLAAAPAAEQRRAVAGSGYAFPHLPRPWGRGADPAQQLAIEEELQGMEHPDYGVGAWVVPTVLRWATDEQRERWLGPSLSGELLWCQMFSEPGAGSDAAAITTRGVRTPGGWRVTGQKVWISRAQRSHRGIATVRTSDAERKQAGITMMVIDLAAPGVEVRPLREASDEWGFGEVFLDDVLVPDGDVLGAVDDGWSVATSTLGTERVTVGSTSRFGGGVVDLLEVYRQVQEFDASAGHRVGELLAETQALRLLDARAATRAVLGAPPGPEGSITKLVRARNTQHSARTAVELLGADGVLCDAAAEPAVRSLVKSRMTSIGGGTSEIVRNLIAERILGLPRDPLQR